MHPSGSSQPSWPVYSQQEKQKAADENQEWLAAILDHIAQEVDATYTAGEAPMPNFGHPPEKPPYTNIEDE